MLDLRTKEVSACKATHEKLVRQISGNWLDALQASGYGISAVDYHLLHRFCCLLATIRNEPRLSLEILGQLVGEKTRELVTDVSFKFAKLPDRKFLKYSGSATIGAHTRTTKFWARKYGEFITAAFQIIPVSESRSPYASIAVKSDLVQHLNMELMTELPPEGRAALRGFFRNTEDLVCSILQRVILPGPEAAVMLKLEKLKKLKTVWIPRPADRLSVQLVRALDTEVGVVRFGHNLAYSGVLKDEQSQRYFPVLDPVGARAINYLDDIEAYVQSGNVYRQVLRGGKAQDLILVPCFPFGDTGYSEYYSNDQYQRDFLTDFIRAATKSSSRDKIVFCIHPGTPDLGYVRAALGTSFRYEVGAFDRLLPAARLVIASYRGTTCVATALATRKRVVIVGNYELEDDYASRGATVVSREQIMADIDRVVALHRSR